ncbi:MAG: DUF4920 domain-containing protein [Flavobacteriales bacterium]
MTRFHAFLFSALAMTLASCETSTPVDSGGEHSENQTFYGSVIDTDGGISGAEVRRVLAESGRAEVRLEGNITATCTKKGCWMDVASGGDTVFVRFQDYSFFVPTEGADGKRTVIQGEAFYDTLTVAMLQHYAEDAGKSADQIAAITEPELRLAFTATGVMIED